VAKTEYNEILRIGFHSLDQAFQYNNLQMNFTLLLLVLVSCTKAFHSNGTPLALMKRSLYSKRRSNTIRNRNNQKKFLQTIKVNDFSTKYNRRQIQQRQTANLYKQLLKQVATY
jgi:hypothetical protein